MQFTLLATSGRARRGRLELAHGAVDTPVFMPVGTYGTVKAMAPNELEEIGAQIVLGNTFHLWLRPGRRSDRRASGPPPLHGLAAAAPHRFRRLPGMEPGRAAQGARGGRRLRVAGQRRPAAAHAGNLDAGAARARFRHRDGVRRMHAVSRDARGSRRVDGAVAALGASLARRIRRARQSERPLRNRAGRDVRRPARRARSRGSSTSASTATPSAACRSASRRRPCWPCSITRRRGCRRTGRAT